MMLDPGVTKVRSTPTATWFSKAKAAKAALPHKADTRIFDHEKLYNLCIGTAFKDDASRASHDDYLAYRALVAILEEIKEATSVVANWNPVQPSNMSTVFTKPAQKAAGQSPVSRPPDTYCGTAARTTSCTCRRLSRPMSRRCGSRVLGAAPWWPPAR